MVAAGVVIAIAVAWNFLFPPLARIDRLEQLRAVPDSAA